MVMRHAIAAVLLLALSGCSTAIAGTATAPPVPQLSATPEQNFRDNLALHGLTTGSDETDQRLGGKVCFHWEQGDTFDQVYGMFVDMTGLSRDDTALFMVVATTQLCPYEMGKIPGQ